MAKQRNNIIMRSTRGMFGKQIVFKRRAGRSYVAAPPEVNENRKATLKQLAVQQRFKTSIAYAKAALTSIELKEAYDKVALRGQSAFNVAFKDAFNAPEIVGIVAEGYQGVAGNVIVVHAKDDFKVNAVKVSIPNSADELISTLVFSCSGSWCSPLFSCDQKSCQLTAEIPDNFSNQIQLNHGYV